MYVTAAGKGHAYLTASIADPGATAASAAKAAYGLIAEALVAQQMQIVHERVFASVSAHQEVVAARDEVISASRLRGAGEATYIQGRPCWGDGLAGVCVQAVRVAKSDDQVRQILACDGGAGGYRWRRHDAEFIILQNLHGLGGGDQDNSPQAQAARMFDKAATALQAHDATFRDVVRTWIYLADILDWYDEFNAARNERYRQFGIMPPPTRKVDPQRISLPASTGIEGENPMGAACVMDVLAIVAQPQRRPAVEQMTNTKQEDAFMYGSAFSRGAYLGEQDIASILFSGTAAIDDKGNSRHTGDLAGQIHRTLDNVEALLAQKGATMAHICEANVFLKHGEGLDVFRYIAAQRGLADMPAVCINADVCREDLLFEMDGVAMIPD